MLIFHPSKHRLIIIKVNPFSLCLIGWWLLYKKKNCRRKIIDRGARTLDPTPVVRISRSILWKKKKKIKIPNVNRPWLIVNTVVSVRVVLLNDFNAIRRRCRVRNRRRTLGVNTFSNILCVVTRIHNRQVKCRRTRIVNPCVNFDDTPLYTTVERIDTKIISDRFRLRWRNTEVVSSGIPAVVIWLFKGPASVFTFNQRSTVTSGLSRLLYCRE